MPLPFFNNAVDAAQVQMQPAYQYQQTVANPQNPWNVPTSRQSSTPMTDVAIVGGGAVAGGAASNWLADKLGANSWFKGLFTAAGAIGGGALGSSINQERHAAEDRQNLMAAAALLNSQQANQQGYAPQQQQYPQQGPVTYRGGSFVAGGQRNGDPNDNNYGGRITARNVSGLPYMNGNSNGMFLDEQGNQSGPANARYIAIATNNPSDLLKIFGEKMERFNVSVLSVNTANSVLRVAGNGAAQNPPELFMFDLKTNPNMSLVDSLASQMSVYLSKMTNGRVEMPFAWPQTGVLMAESPSEFQNVLLPGIRQNPNAAVNFKNADPQATAAGIQSALDGMTRTVSMSNPTSMNWQSRVQPLAQPNTGPQVVNWGSIR